MNNSTAIEETTLWLKNIVIGLNLCPFAHKVYVEDRLGLIEMDYSESGLLENANYIISDVLDPSSPRTTTLLIIKKGLEDFEDYLDTLYALEAGLKAQGLNEEIQLASFHPRYTFEGVEPAAVQNYTNRSPYPIIHFLKVEEMSAAIAAHPNTYGIPDANINKLNELGLESLLKLYHTESTI